MFIIFLNVFTLFFFYYVYILQIYSVRWTDIYRKGQETLVENMYLAGERRKKANEDSANKQKGAVHTFLKLSKPESENMATSRETAETDSVKNAETAVVNVVREEENDVTLTADQHVVMGNEQNVVDPLRNLDDPAMWPEKMERSCIDYLLQKGPPEITLDNFPKNKDGRHFSKVHCKRKLSNGESILRPWLIYSGSADKIYCFYCRILGKQKLSFVNEGFDQWQSCTKRLAEHEKSHGHLDAMTSCCEAGARISKKTGVDNIHQEMLFLRLNVGIKFFRDYLQLYNF